MDFWGFDRYQLRTMKPNFNDGIVTLHNMQLSQMIFTTAMLRMTEYFAQLLKVIPNDAIEYGVCKSPLAVNCNCVCISDRF